MLTTGEDELIARINKLVNENKDLSNKVRALDEQLADAYIEKSNQACGWHFDKPPGVQRNCPILLL